MPLLPQDLLQPDAAVHHSQIHQTFGSRDHMRLGSK